MSLALSRDEALKLVREGRTLEFNNYRRQNPDWLPDFSNVVMRSELLGRGSDRTPFDFSHANLVGTDFVTREGGGTFMANAVGQATNFEGAVYTSDTVFPEYFEPGERGLKFLTRAEAALYMQTSQVQRPPRTFISYSWSDRERVLAVECWLRKQGVPTVLDNRNFERGERLRSEIEKGITSCEVVLCMYSKTAATRPWEEFERELAEYHKIESKASGDAAVRVIFVVMDDVELPDLTAKSHVHIMANGRLFEDVCREILSALLKVPHNLPEIDLAQWRDYRFS